METRLPCRPTRGSLTSPSYLARNRTLGPPLENNPEPPPSSRLEGLRLLYGLETSLSTSLQTPQEACLPLVHPVSSKRYPSRLESRAEFFASTRDGCLSPRVRLECNPEIPPVQLLQRHAVGENLGLAQRVPDIVLAVDVGDRLVDPDQLKRRQRRRSGLRVRSSDLTLQPDGVAVMVDRLQDLVVRTRLPFHAAGLRIRRPHPCLDVLHQHWNQANQVRGRSDHVIPMRRRAEHHVLDRHQLDHRLVDAALLVGLPVLVRAHQADRLCLLIGGHAQLEPRDAAAQTEIQ